MQYNVIYNEDCFATMDRMIENGETVDLIVTSPPYNTGARDRTKTEQSMKTFNARYDVYYDTKSVQEYIDWTIQLFERYDKILVKDGCICYNISYGNENPDVLWLVVADILKRTNFKIADCITWKKNNAFPNNVTRNKLTRVCELIFILCRESEWYTFYSNKKPTVPNGSGMHYTCFQNYIEAKNNDGIQQSLNNATFSSDLVYQLFTYYAKPDSVVYDSFMGIGTTAVAAKKFGINYIGSELSEAQCELARNRLSSTVRNTKRKGLF